MATYDIAIVGAGPAGSTLARILAGQGLEVLLLEKKRMPRYKTCGGGVTAKALELLDFSADEVIEDQVDKIFLSHKYSETLEIDYREPLIFMVMRDRFDQLLANKAVEAGAHLVEEEKVSGIEVSDDQVRITTENNQWQAGLVAGADGANSAVARCLGLDGQTFRGIALEAEIQVPPEELTRCRGVAYLNHGSISYGYTWIFPKEDHLSCGIGTFRSKGKVSRELLEEYLSRMHVTGLIRLLKGHPVPIITSKKPRFHSHRAILLGDAAGLADSFTGEGIYYAIRSAQLAAEVILQAREKGWTNLEKYTTLIKKEILRELHYAARISRVIYPFGGIVHRLVTANPDVAHQLLKVMYGGDTYSALFRRLAKRYRIFRLGM